MSDFMESIVNQSLGEALDILGFNTLSNYCKEIKITGGVV